MSKLARTKRIEVYAIRFIVLFGFLALWQVLGSSGPRGQFFYSTPIAIAKRLFIELSTSSFYVDVWTTCKEVFIGSLLGLILGFAIGMVLWSVEKLGQALYPIVVAMGAVPVFALAPLLVFWFGVGLLGKVAVVSLSVVFISVLATYQAAVQIEQDYRELCVCFKIPRREVFQRLVLMGTLFTASSYYRLAVLFGFIGAFVAEMISSEEGLGHFIQRNSGLYDVTGNFAGLIVFAVCSLLLSLSLTHADRRLATWR